MSDSVGSLFSLVFGWFLIGFTIHLLFNFLLPQSKFRPRESYSSNGDWIDGSLKPAMLKIFVWPMTLWVGIPALLKMRWIQWRDQPPKTRKKHKSPFRPTVVDDGHDDVDDADIIKDAMDGRR